MGDSDWPSVEAGSTTRGNLILRWLLLIAASIVPGATVMWLGTTFDLEAVVDLGEVLLKVILIPVLVLGLLRIRYS